MFHPQREFYTKRGFGIMSSSNHFNPHLRLPIAILQFIVLINLGLLGLSLGGFILSTPNKDLAPRILACAPIAFVAASWLAIRIRLSGIKIRHQQAMAVYSSGMILSILIPMMPFPLFFLSKEVLLIGPLLLAQSLFMIICLGIKMNAILRFI